MNDKQQLDKLWNLLRTEQKKECLEAYANWISIEIRLKELKKLIK